MGPLLVGITRSGRRPPRPRGFRGQSHVRHRAPFAGIPDESRRPLDTAQIFIYCFCMYPLPQTAKELGEAMRRLRGCRGLRQLASSQSPTGIVLSKSSLARFEAGQRPSLLYADHLSKLYGGEGWLEVAIRGLWGSDWNPWSEEVPNLSHVISWPAAYSGMIWMHIRPNPHNVDKGHFIQIRWGPWNCQIEAMLSHEGVVLVTGKEKESVAVSCHVSTSCPVHLLHGVGSGPDSCSTVIDISRDWVIVERRSEV